MSSWGTSISSNDTYSDIYGAFFEMYNKGDSVEEITKKIISQNQDLINDPDDSNNLWFALAKAQWECKSLDSDVLNKVKDIIEKGLDLEVWKNLGATEKDIEKRKIALDNFLNQIKDERPKARSRKKKIIRQPVFQKGDCLTFKLENGNYGGAVVLDAVKDSEYGQNVIAGIRMNQANIPTIDDFKKSEIMILNYANWSDKPLIHYYFPIRHKEVDHLINVVGNLKITKEYDKKIMGQSMVADFDIHFIQPIDRQLKSEQEKASPKIKMMLKEWTKNNLLSWFK